MEKEALVLIEKLAIKLGVTVEHLWEVLIRQVYVSAIEHIVGSLIAGGVLFCLYRLYVTRKNAWEKEDSMMLPTISVAFVMAGLIFLMCLLFTLHTVTIALFNPEYGALEQVMKAIK